jgi:hypothetical protein
MTQKYVGNLRRTIGLQFFKLLVRFLAGNLGSLGLLE